VRVRPAGKGDAAQSADAGEVVEPAELDRRLPRPVRRVRGCDGDPEGGDPRARPARRTYVQIDATDIATIADPAVREQYDGLGIGADRMLGEGIELLDSITEAGNGDVTFGIHLCKATASGVRPPPGVRRDRRSGVSAPEGIRRALARVRRRAGLSGPRRVRAFQRFAVERAIPERDGRERAFYETVDV
jgi:hypothetical protein